MLVVTDLVYRRDSVDGSYVTTLPDGRRVRIRKTGQRNGRMLGGAWTATVGWPGQDIARGGTLTSVKDALGRIADETV